MENENAELRAMVIQLSDDLRRCQEAYIGAVNRYSDERVSPENIDKVFIVYDSDDSNIEEMGPAYRTRADAEKDQAKRNNWKYHKTYGIRSYIHEMVIEDATN